MPNVVWKCPNCGAEQTHDAWCQECNCARFVSLEIQLAEHVLEHLADGVVEPLSVLKAMQARECYARMQLTLNKIAQTMRLVTNDTRDLARRIARAQSAALMLSAIRDGDTKDKIAVLTKWGPETNAERVEHSGSVSIENRLAAARKRSAEAKEGK